MKEELKRNTKIELKTYSLGNKWGSEIYFFENPNGDKTPDVLSMQYRSKRVKDKTHLGGFPIAYQKLAIGFILLQYEKSEDEEEFIYRCKDVFKKKNRFEMIDGFAIDYEFVPALRKQIKEYNKRTVEKYNDF